MITSSYIFRNLSDSFSTMEIVDLTNQNCKYCEGLYGEGDLEGLQCGECRQLVHLKCLRRGAVPGGLVGDIFFQFTCQECSMTGSECFVRDKMPWLQAILLVLYHMQARSMALARRGYFHWKTHIATFIDKYWDVIFRKDFKRKKKWTGTVSGTLSHYSPHFFKSGTALFNEQGWWTLTYSMLSPNVIVQLNAELMIHKQKMKELKIIPDDLQLLKEILVTKSYANDDILKITTSLIESAPPAEVAVHTSAPSAIVPSKVCKQVSAKSPKHSITKKKLPLLPTIDSLTRPKKSSKIVEKNRGRATTNLFQQLYQDPYRSKSKPQVALQKFARVQEKQAAAPQLNQETPTTSSVSTKPPRFLDPMCHYNTSLQDINRFRTLTFKQRLLGGIRNELILSPYTSIYLKPIIRQDTTAYPPWLRLMDELQVKVNQKKPNWKLPYRSSIDFVYVEPEHIAAVNSLCNQFFWTGIDLSDTLQYPDFSCVVMYRKLIVGFGFLIPDVQIHERYLSFLFTRPGWRNCGIAKFILYHLIQTSIGKDITLHVSISNPALFLYQKFGFKVEYVVLDFYDRYMRDDTRDSKHAFFCRLER